MSIPEPVTNHQPGNGLDHMHAGNVPMCHKSLLRQRSGDHHLLYLAQLVVVTKC